MTDMRKTLSRYIFRHVSCCALTFVYAEASISGPKKVLVQNFAGAVQRITDEMLADFLRLTFPHRGICLRRNTVDVCLRRDIASAKFLASSTRNRIISFYFLIVTINAILFINNKYAVIMLLQIYC